MTGPDLTETWLRASLESAIRSAAGGEDRRAHFLAVLGDELHRAAVATLPYSPHLARVHYGDEGKFLWDIFVGRYGADDAGNVAILLRGLWAVECALTGDFQLPFNKLLAAEVDHRLLILTAGGGAIGGLQRQCRVAKTSCWIAEVSPVENWEAGAEYRPWVKLQFIAAPR